MRKFFVTLLLISCIVLQAGVHASTSYGMEVGEFSDPKMIKTQVVNGVEETIYEVTVDVDFAPDAQGNLVPVGNGGTQSRATISDNGGSAVVWTGKLTYSIVTVEGNSCIKPLTYSHMLTVKNDDYVVTKLTGTGGAGGLGYHTNNNNHRGSYSLGPISLSQTNPVSGKSYVKSLNNPGYALYTEISFNTSCSYKYYLKSDANQTIRTSSTYRLSYN